MGLEPTISRTTIWRANQLRHTHHISPGREEDHIIDPDMPGGTRTPDTRLRRPVLYPTELRTHKPFAIAPADLQLRKRVMGIEPTYLAWKASVLPLNYTRTINAMKLCDSSG